MFVPWLLLATAAHAWQILPLVEVEAGFPVRCGYVYRADADDGPGGLELRVEKGVRDGAVVTALDLRGAEALELVTATFDSRRDLHPVAVGLPGRVRLEADLQDEDAGGALFAELGVSGGILRLGRRAVPHVPAGAAAADAAAQAQAEIKWTDYALPAPLPRDITAMYLNCAGDLIRPD